MARTSKTTFALVLALSLAAATASTAFAASVGGRGNGGTGGDGHNGSTHMVDAVVAGENTCGDRCPPPRIVKPHMERSSHCSGNIEPGRVMDCRREELR